MSQQNSASQVAPSQNSRSTSHFIDSIDQLSDTGLMKYVNDLKHQIRVVKLENEILENSMMRLDPSLMNGVQQAIDYVNKLHSNSSLGVGSSFAKSTTSKFAFEQSSLSPSRMLTSPSRISAKRADSSAKFGGTVIFGAGPKINVLERSELASAEMEIIINSLEKSRARAAKRQALLKAQLEEIGLRVVDVQKATEVFNEQVITKGWDKIAQRIPAEIWIRFMNESIKITDTQLGKLRLRTSTLNAQYSKIKGQIKLKSELSESLRPIDFEKLEIENKVCIEKIESKLGQLEELKKMTGLANLNLTVHKKLMMDQNTYLNNILNTITAKNNKTTELDKERETIKERADNLEVQLDMIKKIRLEFEVPDIMDYVRVKAELADLKIVIRTLESRTHIQQISLRSLHQKLKKMTRDIVLPDILG